MNDLGNVVLHGTFISPYGIITELAIIPLLWSSKLVFAN
jgi:hypothetical protein